MHEINTFNAMLLYLRFIISLKLFVILNCDIFLFFDCIIFLINIYLEFINFFPLLIFCCFYPFSLFVFFYLLRFFPRLPSLALCYVAALFHVGVGSFMSQTGESSPPPDLLKPIFVERPTIRQNEDGTKVFISCRCVGNPEPNVSW